MRAVYRLLGLVRRYDPEPVEAACSTSLDLDVGSVTKIASKLAKATEKNQTVLPAAAGSPTGPFARDPGEFAMADGATQLTLIPGGLSAPTPRKGDHPMSTSTNTMTSPARSWSRPEPFKHPRRHSSQGSDVTGAG
jgi:hypothetical protein